MEVKKAHKTRLSGTIIAQHLGLEGYSAVTHNLIKRYWNERIAREAARSANSAIARRFSELLDDFDLTEDERKVIGKFISLKCEQNFDAGLQIGMAAHFWEEGKLK